MCAGCDRGMHGAWSLKRGAAKRGAGNQPTTAIASLEITCGCGKNINKLQIRLGRRSANMFIGTIKTKMICMIWRNILQPHFTPEPASLRTLDEWRNYMVCGCCKASSLNCELRLRLQLRLGLGANIYRAGRSSWNFVCIYGT